LGPLFLGLGGGPPQNSAMQKSHGARSPLRGGPAPSGARGWGRRGGPARQLCSLCMGYCGKFYARIAWQF